MQASSWLEQEQLDERMADLEAQKAALAADLQAAHAELEAARQAAAAQDATLRKLSEQLLREGEATARLKVQLAKEQGMVKSLRAKMNKVQVVARECAVARHYSDVAEQVRCAGFCFAECAAANLDVCFLPQSVLILMVRRQSASLY
jgi:chromosome segregation ATPase